MSFYRIQQADRDATALLDSSTWQSRQWFGETYIDCTDCHGAGCDTCDDTGEVEDVRHGVSACDSVDALVAYFREVGGDFDNAVIVEMGGYLATDEDHDTHLGAMLIIPTAITSVTALDQDTIDRIYA